MKGGVAVGPGVLDGGQKNQPVRGAIPASSFVPRDSAGPPPGAFPDPGAGANMESSFEQALNRRAGGNTGDRAPQGNYGGLLVGSADGGAAGGAPTGNRGIGGFVMPDMGNSSSTSPMNSVSVWSHGTGLISSCDKKFPLRAVPSGSFEIRGITRFVRPQCLLDKRNAFFHTQTCTSIDEK